MTSAISLPLHKQTFSLQHDRFCDLLATTENLLIIQDLDGVCMGLVKDPLHRAIDPAYVKATAAFEGHFYVLTNGEHIGRRGVNGIVERAFGNDTEQVREQRRYLPGLAAGGVQWQDRDGVTDHPGVTDAELAFLKTVPHRIRRSLETFAANHDLGLDAATLERCIQSSALDNVASPTANLNTFHGEIGSDREIYVALQKAMQSLMDDLLTEAAEQGLAASFFVHYAPNHGRDESGKEIVWLSQASESGTTDFQFMLRGAIKEAGVLALLNRYYAQRTGTYPLGPDFSVRTAPHDHNALIQLVEDHFDPAHMPLMVGVGDTVTSKVTHVNGEVIAQRGGSDRNFLHLIQAIGRSFSVGNVVVYVDSSGGELRNRKPLNVVNNDGTPTVTEGPGDVLDQSDPLVLNVVFPGGYQQYCATFCAAAQNQKR
ncbi:glucosylglycerol 3-phosphatase [Oscillatoria sp. CS-180]|uniref:glucosylglycerol 3-phosphatase n=1 Tax=Oscillatoria sp. CS-180 TaxID=3021720 RepID=UPI00232E6046|nr:glucosylglycerol 3-phosphatase [Oscillatoria sp. CS-180]MDB9529438.1 glucosylglycerol 3-phosphatase [Oscillatoria sp. CS-180]